MTGAGFESAMEPLLEFFGGAAYPGVKYGTIRAIVEDWQLPLDALRGIINDFIAERGKNSPPQPSDFRDACRKWHQTQITAQDGGDDTKWVDPPEEVRARFRALAGAREGHSK